MPVTKPRATTWNIEVEGKLEGVCKCEDRRRETTKATKLPKTWREHGHVYLPSTSSSSISNASIVILPSLGLSLFSGPFWLQRWFLSAKGVLAGAEHHPDHVLSTRPYCWAGISNPYRHNVQTCPTYHPLWPWWLFELAVARGQNLPVSWTKSSDKYFHFVTRQDSVCRWNGYYCRTTTFPAHHLGGIIRRGNYLFITY